MMRFNKRSVIQKFNAIQNVRSFLDVLEENRDTDFSCIIVASNDIYDDVLVIKGGNMLNLVETAEDIVSQYDEAIEIKQAENN